MSGYAGERPHTEPKKEQVRHAMQNRASESYPEILAPVGGEEQLIAAVRSGADAVYLGTTAFNARRNAANFDADALKNAVGYCHARNVRVHVTLNTLIKDGETEALCDTVRDIAASGADAVIVQDLAVAKLVKEICPSLPMHASTQMALHNIEGVRLAAELGFSRAVLARELSLKEIEDICATSPIEIEVFVHGALCMSVSGCCEMSCLLGGRSGNRGLCAQPCRLDFQSHGRNYALSLKDLCAVPFIGELARIGVTSLKIEGRMKRPEYVSAAVTACVEARAGRTPDLETLRSVFSRSGFTDGYLTGKRDLSMFGIRTQLDADRSAQVLGSLRGNYRVERNSVPVDFRVAFDGERPALTVTDGELSVSVTPAEGIIPAASTVPDMRERIEAGLKKTGGTPFATRSVSFTGEPLYLPGSAWNDMRRRALETLLEKRAAPAPLEVRAFPLPGKDPHTALAEPKLRLRFRTKEQIVRAELADKLILPLYAIDGETLTRYGDKVIAELPRVTFPEYEESFCAACERLCAMGLKHICTDNLYGFETARRFGFTVHGGFGLNAIGTAALMRYEALGAADMTVSFETAAADIAKLGGTVPRGALVYGYLPLMYFRACPNRTANGCRGCDGTNLITDRKGVRFPVLCERKQFSVLYNSVPLALTRGMLKNIDFETLYFTTEPRAEAEAVIEDYIKSAPYPGAHTRGMYFRDLL